MEHKSMSTYMHMAGKSSMQLSNNVNGFGQK
jgi:hypothetical protein